MPAPVLHNKSPFECLLRQPPNYDFLCTFIYLCFPFLRPYNAHKLDYHFTPYVFLGYSSSHLGYHCLDLSFTTPSAPPPTSSNPVVPLPSSAFIYFNHFIGTGSAMPALSVSASPPAVVSPARSSNSTSPSKSSTVSSPGLDLCVDLSSYTLSRQPSPVQTPAPSAQRQHPMVLRPRHNRTANITSVAASSS